jgi:hypothetical protein
MIDWIFKTPLIHHGYIKGEFKFKIFPNRLDGSRDYYVNLVEMSEYELIDCIEIRVDESLKDTIEILKKSAAEYISKIRKDKIKNILDD